MRVIKMNVFCVSMLAQVIGNQTGDTKTIRRYGRVLDILEEALKPYQKWVSTEGKEKKSIEQQMAEDTPCPEFGIEDSDFDFMKKAHSEFKGYIVKAKEAVGHIDSALDNPPKEKISLLDFKSKAAKEISQKEATG